MIKSRIRTASASAGLLLTLIVAAPVWADDVELLIATPAGNSARPNLLFILDSSGSMDNKVTSKLPYDSTFEYEEVCKTDKYYWTAGTDVPECNGDYEVKVAKFVCQQGKIQLEASGRYTGILAMYVKDEFDVEQWNPLDPEEDGRFVECADDSGVHGEKDGEDEKYAQIGVKQDEWTDDPSREVNWGVQPTHALITVYHGNYLNYLQDTSSQQVRKNDIVKAVMKNVLGSMNNVNVGMMRFYNNEGGPVNFALKELDKNRAAANAVVDSLPAGGWTPLAETLYEAARYFSGMDAEYGLEPTTDHAALDTTSPVNYKQPIDYACTKNFVVLLTDGLPRKDRGVHSKLPLMPGFTEATGGQTACTPDPAQEHWDHYDGCLDDVARYMANADLDPVTPGKQNVVTHTIGFDIASAGQLLQDTADAGEGKYFVANDVATLTSVLTEIATDIFDRDISFTAPAVSVNAFNRTQNLNDLYVSVFRATDKVQWPGNLKKYRLDGATIVDKNEKDAIDSTTGFFADKAFNFWNKGTEADGPDVYVGGTANILPAPADRKLYTNNKDVDEDAPGTNVLTDATNALKSSNSLFTEEDFGLEGLAGEPTVAQIINWARGMDVKDEDADGDTTDMRNAMGDTLHSQPASVAYGKTDGSFDIVVFAATNDGFLHAVDGDTGKEKWAFVPRELLDNFAELYANETVSYKNYGLDGDIVPVVYDEDRDGIIESGTDFVYLLFGMRRGGSNYYMVEVTDPDKPKLRWIKNFDRIGQTWSPPVVAKIDINDNKHTSPQDAVVIVGGGYDIVHDAPPHPNDRDRVGNRITMLDLETGNELWDASRDSANEHIEEMVRSIPGRIRVLDMNGDGYADRMYAADLGGQIFRLDIKNGKSGGGLVEGGVIARLGAEELDAPTLADTRRFYTTPDVSVFTDKRQDRRFVAISIGSGYRAHPLNTANTDRFYSIRDPDVFNQLTNKQYDEYDIITDSDLTEVAGTAGNIIPPSSDGWKLTLPNTEKVLSDSQTFNNTIYFVTMEPRADTTDPCAAGLSVNRLYRVNVVNGDPVYDQGGDVTLDPDEARVTALDQGGIAPKPTFFFPSSDDPDCTGDACRPPPVGCIGTECFDPGFVNFPVRTLWTQDGIE